MAFYVLLNPRQTLYETAEEAAKSLTDNATADYLGLSEAVVVKCEAVEMVTRVAARQPTDEAGLMKLRSRLEERDRMLQDGYPAISMGGRAARAFRQ